MADAFELTDQTVPQPVVGAIGAEVDGDLVLLSPQELQYFAADGEGREVWELIDGTRTFGEIVAALEVTFTAPAGVIRAEAATFLETLHAAGFVTV